MIKKFSCHNFRNINATDLEFERINVLIGPNNSGKSNFMKALTFFSDMLKQSDNGNLKSAFLNAISRNGWEHMLNKKSDKKTAIDFSWVLDLKKVPVKYNLRFEVGNTIEDCNIVLEELNSADKSTLHYDKVFNYFRCHDSQIGKGLFSTAIQKGQTNRRLSFNLDPKETLIMQFKDILLENRNLYGNELIRVNIAQLLYDIQKYFAGFNVYSSAQFYTKKLREPVDIKNIDEILSPDATNFSNIFNNYKSKDFLWKNRFEARIKELIPEVQAADTVTFYDKLIFRLAYYDEQYDLSDISEGTIKGLILNLLINMPLSENCPLLAIDEPESNLHPAWQKVIGNWIQTSDTFDQCFISTHSPDFLDAFTEGFKYKNVAVFVFDSGAKDSIKKITYNDIADELGNWELGDLYRTNDPALGGWPW